MSVFSLQPSCVREKKNFRSYRIQFILKCRIRIWSFSEARYDSGQTGPDTHSAQAQTMHQLLNYTKYPQEKFDGSATLVLHKKVPLEGSERYRYFTRKKVPTEGSDTGTVLQKVKSTSWRARRIYPVARTGTGAGAHQPRLDPGNCHHQCLQHTKYIYT